MGKIRTIAIREYLASVKTKSFLIALSMTPILFSAIFLVPMLLEHAKPLKILKIVVVKGDPGWNEKWQEVWDSDEGKERFQEEYEEEWDTRPESEWRTRWQAKWDMAQVYLEMRDLVSYLEDHGELGRKPLEVKADNGGDESESGTETETAEEESDANGESEDLGNKADGDVEDEKDSSSQSLLGMGNPRNMAFELSLEVPGEFESVEDLKAKLAQRVINEEIFGYVVIPNDIAVNPDADNPVYFTNTPQNISAMSVTKWVTEKSVQWRRAAFMGLDHAALSDTMKPVPMDMKSLSESGEEQDVDLRIAIMAPMVFLMLMMSSIMMVANILITSVIEEKSNRLMEVLLSSARPFELMTGKIVGIGGVGLTLLAIWGSAGFIAASSKGLLGFVEANFLLLFVVYFVLGFILYGSLMAGLGSPFNSIKEAHNLVAPVSLLMFLPMLSMFFIIQNPESMFIKVISYIPFFTPFVMTTRMLAKPAPAAPEIAGTIAVLAVSVVFMVWFASRIFRVGILMYGKPPKLRQILGWVIKG